jgi:hypothetical protein
MIREHCVLELEAQHTLNKVTLFPWCKPQAHAGVVMVDDSVQVGETPIVIETAFEVGGDRSNG